MAHPPARLLHRVESAVQKTIRLWGSLRGRQLAVNHETRKTPDWTDNHMQLLLLHGFDVVAQIADALADRGLVVVFKVLKNRAPDRHLGRAMRGKAGTKAQHALHVLERKLAVVTLCESSQVGNACIERGSGRTAAFAVGTVAGSAILLEHGFAGRDIAGRELRFVVAA